MKVLIPVDGSPASIRAPKFAIDQLPKASFVIVNDRPLLSYATAEVLKVISRSAFDLPTAIFSAGPHVQNVPMPKHFLTSHVSGNAAKPEVSSISCHICVQHQELCAFLPVAAAVEQCATALGDGLQQLAEQ